MKLYDTTGTPLFISDLFDVHRTYTAYGLLSEEGEMFFVTCLPDGCIPHKAAEELMQNGRASRRKSLIFSDPLLSVAIFNWSPQREVDGLARLATVHGATKLLDVGCGFGRLSNVLSQMGFEMVGYDLEPRLIDYANANAALGAAQLYLCADMETFYWPGQFDMAYSAMNSVRYLEDVFRLKNHLRTLASCVRRGGIYAINVAMRQSETHYRNEWDFVIDNVKHRAVWRLSAVRQVRRQVIDCVELWRQDETKPLIREYQCQIDFTSTLLKELLSECGEHWQCLQVLDAAFLPLEGQDRSENVWVVLQRQ